MRKITVIGASMVDIVGKSFVSIIERDSNPGQLSISAGGVSRNIAGNLARLNQDVSLITALGDDSLSQVIVASCQELNINLDHAHFQKDGISTTYLAILDDDGDLALALSDTTLLDNLPLSHIQKNHAIINAGEVIVMDAALPDLIIQYILKEYSQKRIYLDPVSVGKAVSVKDYLGSFYMLKCNVLEASYLSNHNIKSETDFFKAADYFHQLGVKTVVITRGPNGIFYSSDGEQGFYQHRAVSVVNATGAGDAFLAGWVYSDLKNYPLDLKIKVASEVAALTLEGKTSVSDKLSEAYLKEVLENGFK